MYPIQVRRSEFLFNQWVADSEDQIHDKFVTTGAGKLFLSMAQEIKDYETAEKPNT